MSVIIFSKLGISLLLLLLLLSVSIVGGEPPNSANADGYFNILNQIHFIDDVLEII